MGQWRKGPTHLGGIMARRIRWFGWKVVPPHVLYSFSFPLGIFGGQSAGLGKQSRVEVPEQRVERVVNTSPYYTVGRGLWLSEWRGYAVSVLASGNTPKYIGKWV